MQFSSTQDNDITKAIECENKICHIRLVWVWGRILYGLVSLPSSDLLSQRSRVSGYEDSFQPPRVPVGVGAFRPLKCVLCGAGSPVTSWPYLHLYD